MENVEEIKLHPPKEIKESDLLPHKYIPTGQAILVFDMPAEYVERMNTTYEKLRDEGKLERGNKFLVGKIGDEFYMWVDGVYNYIPKDIQDWQEDRIHQYLQQYGLAYNYQGLRISGSWVNDYKAGDYNPNHVHDGTIRASLIGRPHSPGLIGMTALKVPEDMGEEKCNPAEPMNGQIEFVMGTEKQFAHRLVKPKLKAGSYIVFPYDLVHTVYPHFNEQEIRRTWPTNWDVFQIPQNLQKMG